MSSACPWRSTSGVCQDFSVADRTSFAVMHRLGIRRAASFDDDFVVYRFGRDRSEAFSVMR